MKKNKAWLLVVALLGLVGCKPKKPEVEYKEIKDLYSLENNTEVNLKASVYATAANGYFVNDGTGSIFVLDSTITPKVDSYLTIKAKVQSNNGRVTLKNAESVNGGTKAANVKVEEYTVAQINALDSTKQESYNKLVKVVGTVTTSVAGNLTLKSDDGDIVYFATNSDSATLNTYKDTRVSLTATILQKGTQTGWELTFFNQEIVKNEFTFDQLVAFAEEDISSRLATEFCGALVLPSAHPVFTQLTYNWSTNEADSAYVAIANNKATVNFDESDHEVTLSVVISNGTDSTTKTYKVVSKAVVEQSVGSLLANLPTADKTVVCINGIISGLARNQSRTYQGVILQDKTDASKSIQVEVTKEIFAEASLGDEVTATGYYRTIDGGARQCVDTGSDGNLIEYKVISKNNTFAYKEAFEVKDAATMAEFANNWNRYAGQLVKFSNLKAVWNVANKGARVSTSYVILSADGVKSAYSLNGGTETKIVLLNLNNTEFMGSSFWADEMGIGYNSEFTDLEATFYAYPGYFTSGTIAMLNIPGADQFVPTNVEKNVAYNLSSKIISETTFDNVTLPESITVNEVTYPLTWTSSHPAVIDNSGKLTPSEETITVTLTATFEVNGEAKTYAHEVVVIGSKALTVSELYETKSDLEFVKVNGTVVGYQQVSSFTSAGLGRIGYILLDEATGKVIYTNGANAIGGDLINGYKDSEGNLITMGDSVTVTGTYHTTSSNPGSGTDEENESRHYIDLVGGTATVVSHANPMAAKAGIVTVNNNEELAALVKEGIPYNQIIKFVATTESPLFFRTHGSNWGVDPLPEKTGNNISISYEYVEAGKKFESAKSADPKCVALSANGNHFAFAQLGLEPWYTQVGYNPESEGAKVFKKATGEFYAVFSYTNSSYFHLSVVDPTNWTMKALKTEEDYAKEITALFPTSLTSGTSYEVTSYSDARITDLAYTSSNTDLLKADGTTVVVPEDTDVVLTVTYKLDGVEKSFNVTVTLRAPKTLTVDEVIAFTENTNGVKVEGVVVAYASHGNSDKTRTGVTLVNPVTGKTVLVNDYFSSQPYPTFVDDDQKEIKVGTTLTVIGDYDLGHEAEECNAIKATSVKAGAEVTLDFAAMTNVVTISNSEQLGTFLATPNALYQSVVKVTGTADNKIAIGGSSSKENCNFKIAYNDKNNTSDMGKYNGKTLSVKETTNTYYGTDWYTKAFDGVTKIFAGMTSSKATEYIYTGDLYIVVNYITSSYYQAAVVNFSNWSLVRA